MKLRHLAPFLPRFFRVRSSGISPIAKGVIRNERPVFGVSLTHHRFLPLVSGGFPLAGFAPATAGLASRGYRGGNWLARELVSLAGWRL